MRQRMRKKLDPGRPILDSDLIGSDRIPSNPVVNFQRLKNSTTSIKQSVEKICQAGIDKVDINKRQSNITTIKDDCDRGIITGENDLEQRAYKFIRQLNEEMCKANFVDFPILLDEFHSQKCI